METIPSCEIKFHPHSFGDDNIRLFQWNGQIYRGLNSEKALYFRELFDHNIIQTLVEKRFLVDSEITPFKTDKYEMVIRHRKLPFTSYPNEWCAAMLKNAALVLIDLAIELSNYGLTLGDAHPWNILIDIDTCKPIFIDLGSLQPIQSSTWPVYDEFCRYCLYPLILMSYGQDLIARLLMCEDEGVLKSELLVLTQGKAAKLLSANPSVTGRLESFLRQRVSESSRTKIKTILNSIRSPLSKRVQSQEINSDFSSSFQKKSHLRFLQTVKQEIQQITFSEFQPELKGTYQSSEIFSLNQDSWTSKQLNVYQILNKLNPVSVLDIHIGTGWYPKLVAHLGSKVIAFDMNHKNVSQLYFDTLAHQLSILPLIMDFTKTTPARGLKSHWAIAATKRLQCDMVLALDAVHHIVFKRHLNFDQIAEGLTLFSTRWVVVEFISAENPEISEYNLDSLGWYKLENLMISLKKHFSSLSIISSPSESQVLLLGEK